jgi:hypothetical protein
MKPIEHLLALTLFGGVFAFVIYGTLTGDLQIPYRRGSGGLSFPGYLGWLLAGVPLVLYAAVLVRFGTFPELRHRLRTFVEFALLTIGILLLAFVMRHGVHVPPI